MNNISSWEGCFHRAIGNKWVKGRSTTSRRAQFSKEEWMLYWWETKILVKMDTRKVKAQNECLMCPAAISGSWKWTCWLALCFHVKIPGSCFFSWFMISDTSVHGWLVLSHSARHYFSKAVYYAWFVVEKAVQFMEASKQKETGLAWLPTFFLQLDLTI